MAGWPLSFYEFGGFVFYSYWSGQFSALTCLSQLSSGAWRDWFSQRRWPYSCPMLAALSKDPALGRMTKCRGPKSPQIDGLRKIASRKAAKPQRNQFFVAEKREAFHRSCGTWSIYVHPLCPFATLREAFVTFVISHVESPKSQHVVIWIRL